MPDALAGINNGTAGTGVTDLTVPGILGTGAEFDGSVNQAEINLASMIGFFDAPWSVSFWAQQAADNESGMALGHPINDNSFIHLDGSNGLVRFRSGIGLDSDFTNQPSFSAGLEQYALTSDGDNLSLYRQGMLVGTQFVGDVAWTISALGTGRDTGNTELDGVLDEVRVGSVERSSNWVWASYQTLAANSQFTCYEEVVGPLEAEEYSVFGFAPNRVYDGQIANGDYSVSIQFTHRSRDGH